LVVLGAAFAGGVVVAALLGGGRSRRSNISEYRPTYQSTSAAEVHASGGTWHRLRGAFGAVAAGAAMELLNKAAPGLKEHLIDPVREHMNKGDDRVGTYSGSSPFAAPSAMRTNGYNAPDTM